jgi:hypothetical protein
MLITSHSAHTSNAHDRPEMRGQGNSSTHAPENHTCVWMHCFNMLCELGQQPSPCFYHQKLFSIRRHLPLPPIHALQPRNNVDAGCQFIFHQACRYLLPCLPAGLKAYSAAPSIESFAWNTAPCTPTLHYTRHALELSSVHLLGTVT